MGHNVAVGKHSGEATARARRTTDGPPRRTVLLLAAGLTATLVAWGVLVFVAIDFGLEARSGQPAAWVLLALSTLGAAACLFVTLLLGARLWTLLKGQDPDRPDRPAPPPRIPGGRRAAR